MVLKYHVIEIFTSEEARYKGRPLYLAVLEHVRGLKIAARGIVTKAVAGCYENGEIATHGIEVLSFNMPLKIEIIMPAPELEIVLPAHRGDGDRRDCRGRGHGHPRPPHQVLPAAPPA